MTPSADTALRSARWTLADVVDFEHWLAQPDAVAQACAMPGAAGADRRAVFHAWLRQQREGHSGAPTPGEQLQQGERLLSALAWGVGLALGAGLAGTWLAGSGAEPVNAPLFWVATVGLQLVLLVVALLGWWSRRRWGGAAGGLVGLLQAAMTGAATLLRRLPGERRDALRAALGRLAMRHDAQSQLLVAPAVALAQRFAIAFNLGLLAAMLLLHLPLVDLRFGWQSSYPVRPDQVHLAVQALATPWRWALPQAQPSVDEVAATRYVRGDASARLPAEAARAWWPFLALSIACYGLLLRAALLCGARWQQRRTLARLRFDHPAANALWRRLSGPLLRSDGGLAELPGGASVAHAQPVSAGDCALLVAQELAAEADTLAATVRQRLGSRVLSVTPLPLDDRGAIAPLVAQLRSSGLPATVLVAAPASRDPIVAIAAGLRALLQALAPGTDVLLLLVQADDERLTIWRRFVQIQHLRLGVEALP
ncbi:DUF2868 domain-containing protein [Ideonella sp. BN130291]|uniref:DUF2868 domain-containing protein n=1 Tax=Ideonella sp. BN130291 TaxID=3112940 RepID=UPI002E26C483